MGTDGLVNAANKAQAVSFPIPIPLMLIIGVILLFGICIVLFGSKPKQDQKKAEEKTYKKLYTFLTNFFLTSGKMQKIAARLSALSVYTPSELRKESTKYFAISALASVSLVVAAFLLFKDTIALMICTVFAAVLNNILVDKQVGKVHLKVYQQLKQALSSIRQEYLRLGSVSEAIAEADIPELLRKPFDDIYTILTSADSELLLLRFYESNPFRSIQTMAGICFNINNSGDGRDEFGQSNFVQALTMLSSEVNSELERLALMKARFGVIEYLPLVPIFLISIIENYFIKTMPGTALIYNGNIGHICKIFNLLMCSVCYTVVANINNASSVKDDDRSHWSQQFLRNQKFRQFIYNIEPKNLKREKLKRKLKSALSKKAPQHLYAEKLIYALVGLIFAVLTTFTVISMSKEYYLESTDQLSLVADDSMKDYSKEDILALDMSYMDRDHEWSEEEFTENVKSFMPTLGDLQVQDQIARIQNKENALKTAYFHWYYIIICFVVGLIGWCIPNIMLKVRTILVKTEAEDDFLQLQTLMSILMNMEMDTLDVIWQMCQHSRIHKDMLLYCYHSYPSDPELELDRLIYQTNLVEFKRFIGKLKLTVSDLSLAEAYSDLKIERDHMLRVREISMKATIERKRKLCGPVAMFPFICLVIGEFLIPIGYLGYKEFSSALGSMGA